MQLALELEREVDGRWIADIPQLGILLYGSTREEAIQLAREAVRELAADKLDRGTGILIRLGKGTRLPGDL
jgi:predicted RNase H-like HicB family nuclease